MSRPRRLVFLGLSITSSWGNGHATTYRALLRALARRGHEVTFLERDQPWYADNRDLPRPPFCRTVLYQRPEELLEHRALLEGADLVVVGSYVPDGAQVGDLVLETARGLTAFYDIDTPVTARALERDECAYLRPDQVGRYRLYLSFTGGPLLAALRERYRAEAHPLYCACDPDEHRPCGETPIRWDLGYLGTYSADRQPGLERLLLSAARRAPERRFAVGGAQYPAQLAWPDNVARFTHVPPPEHAAFYCAQRFTLNLTRADMLAAGYSPSVRLFEAAACGVPVVSDRWAGLERFFEPGRELLIADDAAEVLALLAGLPEAERRRVGERARARVLGEHTAAHRADTLERYLTELGG